MLHLQFPQILISPLSRFRRYTFFVHVFMYVLYVCMYVRYAIWYKLCQNPVSYVLKSYKSFWFFLMGISFLKRWSLFKKKKKKIGGVEVLMQEPWKWSWAVWYIDCIKSTSFLEVLDSVLSHMQRPGPCAFIQLHNFDEKGNLWGGLYLIDLGPLVVVFWSVLKAHRKDTISLFG